MHLCVQGIAGYTQIKRHRGSNVCERRDERGTCVWGGASSHLVQHCGHIKFNVEPNCTLVFVESGCLFVCGAMTFWMREEGTWSLFPLQQADCSFVRFCFYSLALIMQCYLFLFICFVALGLEPRARQVLLMQVSSTERHPSLFQSFKGYIVNT